MTTSNTAPRLLLGVSGGIAAYKAHHLARLFVKAGWEVQVVMTAAAAEFVTPMTFQALTGRPTRSALFDAAHEAAMGHIELARWADVMLVAPASAQTLARLALGLADDLLSTLALASDRPLWVAPAMNRLMWAHPATQANVATLRHRGVHILGPGSGEQACGETGDGRMLEPENLFAAITAALAGPQAPVSGLQGLRAVVTAGPTREPLDPVRFITNRSSGKQGYAVAAALAAAGVQVTLVSGPTALPSPAGVRRVAVETAEQMLAESLAAAEGAQLFVGAAAVADYRAEAIAADKIKKTGDTLQLTLRKNPDILASVRVAHPALFVAGFAAETENLAAHAQDKLRRKQLDLIAANWVGPGKAFDTDDNALSVFWPGGACEIAAASKAEVARQLVALIAQHYSNRHSA
jgi:phosphopantothenoylcysteine decarboxylase / phosphopantothenate---cysteine ligase